MGRLADRSGLAGTSVEVGWCRKAVLVAAGTAKWTGEIPSEQAIPGLGCKAQGSSTRKIDPHYLWL